MSKFDFVHRYGSLDQMKQAVSAHSKETWGYYTNMDRLLTRMKAEGDPDYATTVEAHMKEALKSKESASFILYSKHSTDAHKHAACDMFPTL